jgi:hypothetical protein
MKEKVWCPNCNAKFAANADKVFADSARLDCPNCKLSSTLSQFRSFADPSLVTRSAPSTVKEARKPPPESALDSQEVIGSFGFDKEALKGCLGGSAVLCLLGYFVLYQYGCVGPSLKERERESAQRALQISSAMELDRKKLEKEQQAELRRITLDGQRQVQQLERRQIEIQQEAERKQLMESHLSNLAFMASVKIKTTEPFKDLVRVVIHRERRAIFTVENTWHFLPYQMRLQHAQRLQTFWSEVVAESYPRETMFDIVDITGNHVGGSGLTGVWVQKQ